MRDEGERRPWLGLICRDDHGREIALPERRGVVVRDLHVEHVDARLGLLDGAGQVAPRAGRQQRTSEQDHRAWDHVSSLPVPSCVMSDRDALLSEITSKAVVHGKVVLSSGREADYYIDLRRITLDATAAPLVGSVMLDLTSDLRYDAVGGLTLGADPVATAMLHVAAARGRKLDAFVVRKEARRMGCNAASRAPTSPDDGCSRSKTRRRRAARCSPRSRRCATRVRTSSVSPSSSSAAQRRRSTLPALSIELRSPSVTSGFPSRRSELRRRG